MSAMTELTETMLGETQHVEIKIEGGFAQADKLLGLVNRLADLPAEDPCADGLVEEVAELIVQRQMFIDSILADDCAGQNAELILALLDETQALTYQCQPLLAHRQALLHLGHRHKQQVSIYKTIDANR